MLQEMARKFAQTQIKPKVQKMDEESEIAPEIVSELFQLGLMGIEIPEQYGGSGMNFTSNIIAIEEIAAVDPSVAVVADVQNTLVNNAVIRYGTEQQKQKFLPLLASEKIGAYSLSESSSGSDAFGLATQAREESDHFVLNGQKLWVTNGGEADIFLVFATIDKSKGYRGITSFIVEKSMPGFSVGKREKKLGIRASSTCELILEDVCVPKENILGERGKGYKIAIETLNEGRIGIGGQMIGLARGALNHAIAYAKDRKQFGKSISEFQAIQFSLAQMATELEAARLMVYNAARLKDAKMPFIKEAAMAKYFSSIIAEKVASKSIEIFGGYGFTKEYPVEKYYRDAKVGQIYEGTTNMQLMTIAKILLEN
ncbi:MAG: acyl-CoA dehydrogenase [Candidatus Brocadiae bacterium]|nr:acyl-CoA dehydrogenase [Candidatus Brocadiia bacterium]